MEIIGLTGSIGMGKSAAANMLRQMGIPVFDSDGCVHELLDTHQAAISAIQQAFPACWDKNKASLDRQALGKRVFQDKIAKKKLEEILHPLVWKAQRDFIARCRRAGHKQVVLDIPLLYETGSERKCDRVLCVSAPDFIQRQRVLKRPGMTEDKLAAILSGQIPDQDKRRLADHVIPTGLGRAYTLKSLKKALGLSALLPPPPAENEE